jgi:hypothetical protein
MSSKWELTEVGNEGQLKGTVSDKDVTVPTDKLFIDMKSHLMFIPNNFTWSVGWRAYVWRNKETNRLQDLTEEEFKELISKGSINYTRDGGGSDTTVTPTEANEGSTTE